MSSKVKIELLEPLAGEDNEDILFFTVPPKKEAYIRITTKNREIMIYEDNEDSLGLIISACDGEPLLLCPTDVGSLKIPLGKGRNK